MNRLKKKEDERATQSVSNKPEVDVTAENAAFAEYSEPTQHKDVHGAHNLHKSNIMPPDAAKEFMERIKELEEEVQTLRAERDDLVHEKKFWLSRFQTDNAKLAALLKVCYHSVVVC